MSSHTNSINRQKYFFSQHNYLTFESVLLTIADHHVISPFPLNQFFFKMSIQHDGCLLNANRDPPGQHSVYIFPGDHRTEVYRLITFDKFPPASPVDPVLLARNGFYYLGYKDRVKCFDCANIIQDWTHQDDALSIAWHQSHCQFATRQFYTNVPICPSSIRSCEQYHQATVQNTSILSPEAHQQHVPPPVSPNHNLKYMYPCNNPVNPHMRSLQSRLTTFDEHISAWPQHRLASTPQDMATAGLYYLGTNDRVKCFYCNGGLQNWDRYDTPWFEHAKWFPKCEFLLQQKGPEYVESVTCRFSNLRRPTIPNPVSLSATNQPPITTTPLILDYQKSQSELLKRTVIEMQKSLLTPEAKTMGFTEEEITRAFFHHLSTTGSSLTTFTDLVNLLPDPPNDMIPLPSTDTTSSLPSSATDPIHDHGNDEETNPKETLQTLHQKFLCKQCLSNKATIVFLPCGHMVACKNCNNTYSKCLVCHTTIRERIQAYLV